MQRLVHDRDSGECTLLMFVGVEELSMVERGKNKQFN
jgi:hypothetical protein